MKIHIKYLSRKSKQAAIVLVLLAVAGAAVAYIGVSRPFACKHRKHKLVLEQRWQAWRRGEISDDQILRELIVYAKLKPSFGEKWKWEDPEKGHFGGYSTLHRIAMKRICEINTPKAIDVLTRYIRSPDRKSNAQAIFALHRRGDKRIVPALMKLLEMEDERARQSTSGYRHNPHLLTGNTLGVLADTMGAEALPLLNKFLAAKDRRYKREVEEAIFRIENDNSKPVNIPGLKDTVTAETNLEITPCTIYEGLEFETAHEDITFIRKALASFSQLTESLDKSVFNEHKKKIAHMDWETQNLGLPNSSKHVEAVLMKQDYLIKKMEYQLAKQRFDSGRKVSPDRLTDLKAKYKSSERKLVNFLNEYTFAD